METWMVSLGLALIGGISISAVLRSNVQRLSKSSENHDNDITSLKEKIMLMASIREVREEFVSKEMFSQMRKHFDDKFERLERGLNKILTKMEK